MKEFKIPLVHSRDTLTSGWLCLVFYLSFYPMYQIPGPAKEEDCVSRGFVEVFTRTTHFIALYLLVDHYVDSPSNSREDKQRLLAWLCAPNDSPPREEFKELLKHVEVLGSEHIPELVAMTVGSYEVQNTRSSTKTYLQECRRKGEVTTIIGVKMIFGHLPTTSDGKEIEDGLRRLGFCAQLLDDLTDCSDDLASGINNACTHQVRKVGNVDRLVWELLYELTLLPKSLQRHAMCLQWMTVYVVNRSKHTSKLLRKVLGLAERKQTSSSSNSCMRLKLEEILRRPFDTSHAS